MGCLPRSALFLVTESIPEFICPWRKCGDPGLPWV
ncbi:hypothetical protein Tco_1412648, partial [Tanacetum coccineum]